MSYATRLWGTINVVPDFETLGSVPQFDTVKLEHRMERPADPYAPVKAVIGGISAHAPTWVSKDEVEADLVAITKYILTMEPNTKFVGFFEAQGEESDDRWRVYIVDGQPTFVEPTVTWPEPSSAGT